MPKRKFIDKKKSVTFSLVHRSQQDPLVTDETAPQHVFMQMDKAQDKKKMDKDKRREEQHKYGVYFDDDYDYLQHLKEVDDQREVFWSKNEVKTRPSETKDPELTAPVLNLPSSVFASKYEEDVGLLNKAAPQSGLRLDLDPEIVAAMDDDFDFSNPDNELEDNFLELANASGDEDINSDWEDEEADEVASLNRSEFSFDDEETKSRFTQYSMSSSVIRRNEQLTLLDDRFEKMFIGYDDEEIGALDAEEIEGDIDVESEMLKQCAEEFARVNVKGVMDGDNRAIVDRVLAYTETSDNPEMVNVTVTSTGEPKWDCESILSTYSTLYNHPKLISERKTRPDKIRLSNKTGIPINESSNKLTIKALEKFNLINGKDTDVRDARSQAGSILSTISLLSVRPKNETRDEHRERKRLLKTCRRERRVEKKLNTEAFKEERKRQERIFMNNVSMNKIV